ncbi:rod shape-determining protein MreC [Leeia sp. TBRC 13508]|uniref:Cell shape-determining protein MreC n=1 Tax=Leeia speluncae TaxID=2884804 RepID=A0ABS8D7D7_9NEIS|nr:rod shape-determining protein MreC [Leeia speluncae]MCB6184103.1 rod shape-determining protein MreC [Leeia speluncae]
MEKESQPAFFGNKQTPLSKLLWFGIASLVLIFTDSRFRYLETVRDNVSVALYPLQQAAMLPGNWFESSKDFLTKQHDLTTENQRLRLEKLEVTAQLQAANRLAKENETLRSLMGLTLQHTSEGIISEMIYAGRDPFTRKIIIDKGTNSKIAEGSPVLDTNGLIGQVTRVHQLVAEVTLITDKNFPVPVEVARTGQRTVVFGTGHDSWLEVRYAGANADIKKGDLLQTSGIDGTYPAGITVARVEMVEHSPGLPFSKIWCRPLGGVEHSRHYLILNTPAKLPEYPASEETPASQDKKKNKGKS